MRVALLQICFDPKSRAANLQAVLAGIGQAASVEPAPDLLILPGACEAAGIAGAGGATSTSRSGFCEALATQAREWGVFIAAGMGAASVDDGGPQTLLFDPDGDVLARAAIEEYTSSGACPSWANTVLGTVGVALPSVTKTQPPVPAGALIAVPIAAASAKRRARTDERFVSALLGADHGRQGAYWAVVTPAGPVAEPWEAEVPGTFLCDPAGKVWARADTTDEIVVLADLPLVVAAAESVCDKSDRTPQAG